jgi:hypothetical protein
VSVKVTAELNPVSRKRTVLETEPGSIKDIITSLNTGFSLSMARVSRNGEIVKDFSIIANDGDELCIKFVPQGSPREAGIGMKIGGWALAVAGGILIATGYGSALGVMLIGAGIGMIAGGTVLMNINIPGLQGIKDRETPENDPSIRGGRNQTRPHGRIPVLFGRHRLYPDIAANPYTEIIDGKQYLVQLFCGGYKDCVIDVNSFKLGETPVTDLSHTKNIVSILSGADPVVRIEILQNGEASSVYPYCVHEEAVNAPLKNITDEGMSGAVIRTTPDNTDSINVDIFFQNGLGRYNDNGDLVSASVEVKVSYKPFGASDSNYAILGYFNNGSNIISGAELKTKRFQITRNGLAPDCYTVRIERVTPDSSDYKVIDQVYAGSIRSIKSARPVRAGRQKDLTIIALRLMATGQLNNIVDRFNYVATAKLPVWSGNGSDALYWLNTTVTRNPASALLYALWGRAAQQSVDPGDINWPSFEAFYSWCEEHGYTCDAYLSESVTIADLLRMIGGTSRADILRIDSKISVVQDIERPSPVQLFTPKNTIGYSVSMFSADVPDAISLRFIDEDSGYAQNEVQIFNTPDGKRVKEPESIQKIDLWGVTNSVQARRIGMYNYGCIKNRPFVHTVEVDIEYLLCDKGDWVQYAGDIALTGSVQGRIMGVIWADGVCVGIDTDELAVMDAGKEYAVRIRKSNGVVILKEVIFSPGQRRIKATPYYPGEGAELYDPFVGDLYPIDEENNFYYEPQYLILFKEPLEVDDAPEVGDIYAFGVRGYEVLDLVITDIRPGQNLSAILTCVEYSPEIFGVDYPGFVLPEFVNRVTPVSGAVDSGVVNSDRWKLFAVYHDSEEEPARPSGDGQSGGWHYVQTFRSVWQSTKMAESVESGEWGLPVRIKAERGSEDLTPIWLSLLPQSKLLECDSEGKVLAGLLPFTSQARLHKWNSILTGAAFSLPGAPSGVTINANGVITVAANAALNDENNITVRAEFQGGVYTAVLSVTRDVRSSAPRYLGTVQAIPQTATVMIIKGPVQGQARARQGDYVLSVATAGGRPAGSVFQWTGLAWEYRSPANHADLYIRCFKDGLDEPGLAYDKEWFGAVFAKLLVAQQAFIEELQAQVITLSRGGIIQSSNFVSGQSGFRIKANGDTEFNNSVYRGRVEANEGYFKNGRFDGITAIDIDIGGNSTFKGNIDTDVLKVMPSQPHTFNFSGDWNVLDVMNNVSTAMGFGYLASFTIFPTDGYWQGYRITRIFFDRLPGTFLAVIFITTTNQAHNGVTGISNLSFTVGTGGRTVKLVGLPTSTTVQNEVFKSTDGQGNYYLKVKS